MEILAGGRWGIPGQDLFSVYIGTEIRVHTLKDNIVKTILATLSSTVCPEICPPLHQESEGVKYKSPLLPPEKKDEKDCIAPVPFK